MKIEDIERAELLISVIKQAQGQIERYKDLKAVKEVALVANDNIFKELIRAQENGRYTKENPPPMYYSGNIKDAMIDVLIQNKQDFLDKQLASLETL